MRGSGAVNAFEPVLIEKGGQRRLAESRLPDDPEQRGRRFVGLALQGRQACSALGRNPIDRVGARSEPELDEPSPLGRSQHKMGNFVQDHICLRRRGECLPVPVKGARSPFGVDRHAEFAGQGERREAMLLGFCPDGAVRRGRADAP